MPRVALLGYDIVVLADAIDSFIKENYNQGIAYIKTIYGAKMIAAEQLRKAFFGDIKTKGIIEIKKREKTI